MDWKELGSLNPGAVSLPGHVVRHSQPGNGTCGLSPIRRYYIKYEVEVYQSTGSIPMCCTFVSHNTLSQVRSAHWEVAQYNKS